MQEQEYFIKTFEGEYVAIKKSKYGLKLCAKPHQDVDAAPSVKIVHRRTNPRQMAFIFRYNKARYFPMVVGNKLKVQKCCGCSQLRTPTHSQMCPQISQSTTLQSSGKSDTDNPWFEKVDVGSGDHFNLQSVASSSRRLKIDAMDTFSFTEEQEGEFARITFVEKLTREPHTTNQDAATTQCTSS